MKTARKCKLEPRHGMSQTAATLCLCGMQAARASEPYEPTNPPAWREGFEFYLRSQGLPLPRQCLPIA